MDRPKTQRKNPNRLMAIVAPVTLVAVMWIIHFVGWEYGWNLSKFGLRPRTAQGLLGILTMPFIHGSWQHLFNNSIPLLVLGWALFTFYRGIAFKSLVGIYLISGIWLWISGRTATHIGASGVVYGLAAFLFLSGWLRHEKKVAALSLLVAFLYGGMWWGVLPVDPTISWEGHFWGAIAGFSLAVLYRKQGPKKPEYTWEHDEELERMALGKPPPPPPDIADADAPPRPVQRSPRVVYHYRSATKPHTKSSGDIKSDGKSGES